MSAARGMGSLAAARLCRIVGGLATHGLLGWVWGADGYGQYVLALSVLGLLRVWELHTPAAVTTLVPLLLAEGRGAGARRLVWLAYALQAVTALITSAALWFLREPLAAWAGAPALASLLAAAAVWNLLPLLRGPVDGDVLVALRAWRPLLLWRACEQAGTVAAALWTVATRGTPASYFPTLLCCSLPALVLGWTLLPVLAAATRAGLAAPDLLPRLWRTCLPLTVSQVLFRLYSHLGAPLLAGTLSVAAAGSYKLALNVADLAVECAGSVPQALQSELSLARQRGAVALAQAYARVTAIARLGAAPLVLALWLAPQVAALLGRFQLSAFLLAVLSLQVLLRLLAGPATQLLLARERAAWVTRANALKLGLELLLAWPLIQFAGVLGLVVAHGLAVVPGTLWLLRAARRALRHDADRTPAAADPVAVTMVTNSRALGGLERHVLDLVAALSARGVACHLLCPADAVLDPWVAAVTAAGARSVTRAGVAAPWDLAGMARMAGALARAPGLLHFHLNSLDDLAPGLILAALLGRRAQLIATLQLGGRDRPRPWSVKDLRRRVSLVLPRHMLAVSAALRDEVVPRWRRDPRAVVVSHNGIAPEPFAGDPTLRAATRAQLGVAADEHVLLFVGRLTAQKGVAVLLDAVGSLGHTLLPDTRVRLLLAGDGPLRPELEQVARQRALPATFLGTRRDVHALLCGADALVLPSLHEGLPFVLLEAMAAGVPVVATRVGGVPELLSDGDQGLLVPAADAPALAWALARIIKMPPAERRRMAMAGVACVRQRFTLARQVEDVLAGYAALTGTPPPVSPKSAPPESEVVVHAGCVR